jgi:hypothetical protein
MRRKTKEKIKYFGFGLLAGAVAGYVGHKKIHQFAEQKNIKLLKQY